MQGKGKQMRKHVAHCLDVWVDKPVQMCGQASCTGRKRAHKSRLARACPAYHAGTPPDGGFPRTPPRPARKAAAWRLSLVRLVCGSWANQRRPYK